MTKTASEAIEQVARVSYGKLVALLAVRTRNIAAAEDALSGALIKALDQWPNSGLPHNPEAWLLTTARRVDMDAWQRTLTARDNSDLLVLFASERVEQIKTEIPDERLHLLFACAHPAIDPAIHLPLMLQVVLGVSANRIASALLLPPTTIGQRLSRAKAKIKDTGLRFALPETEELPARVGAVLRAIYAAFTLGNDSADDNDCSLNELTSEAVWLARVVFSFLPEQNEVKGLLALMLFTKARHAARRSKESSRFVPLSEQDVSQWDHALIDEAEHLLHSNIPAEAIGRFGLEAAIQAVHCARRKTNITDWGVIEHLYRGLNLVSPTIGAKICHAIAVSHAESPKQAIMLLSNIPIDRIQQHLPYWAALAYVENTAGNTEAALYAYQKAIGITEDPLVRGFLESEQQKLISGQH